MIDPNQFTEAFTGWMKMIATVSGVIAFDGKSVRHSFDKLLKKSTIHMMSAWSDANRLVLGQVKVDSKSNEIAAIPKLLKLLAIKGCLITIDAIECQTAIAEQIAEQGGDYLLTRRQRKSKTFIRG